MGGGPVLEVPVDAAHGELEPGAGGAGHGLSLGLARVLACLASGHRGLNWGRCGGDTNLGRTRNVGLMMRRPNFVNLAAEENFPPSFPSLSLLPTAALRAHFGTRAEKPGIRVGERPDGAPSGSPRRPGGRGTVRARYPGSNAPISHKIRGFSHLGKSGRRPLLGGQRTE